MVHIGRCCQCLRPPVNGSIYRTVHPSLVADYDGISTDSISTGTSGTYFGNAWNIYYYILRTPNAKTTDASEIIGPVRWSIDVPSTNNTKYDWWQSTASAYKRETAQQTGLTQVTPISNNAVGLINTLLPASGDSHCVAPTTMSVRPTVIHNVSNSWIHRVPVESSAFAYPDLDAIIHPELAWDLGSEFSGFYFQEYAVKDYVNGVFYDGSNPATYGDTWYRDVWYRIKFTHNASFPAEPRNFGIHWRYAVTSNGSYNVGQTRLMEFRNYEMATNFNPSAQSYQISASGPFTWTFQGGTTGPETIRNVGNWVKESVINGSTPARLRWRAVNQGLESALVSVELIYGQEIPMVVLEFKSSFASANSMNTKIPYTPTADGNYLSSTYHTDAGATITHCDLGCFDQAGTTVFKRVSWDAASADWDGANFDSYGYRRGRTGGGAPPSIPEAPTTVTLTRT